MSAEQPLTGRAESLLPGGDALVRSSEQLFLLANCVPGDLVSFSPDRKRRGAARGLLIDIAEPSIDRVTPPCPIADQCGGCALQSLQFDRHAALKSGWVLDAFRRNRPDRASWMPIAQAQATIDDALGCPDDRRRLRWYVGEDAEGVFLGFRVKTGHAVVRHRSCMTATSELNALRSELESVATQLPLKSFESIQAVQLDDGIHLILEGEQGPRLPEPPFRQIGKLSVQWWFRDDEKTLPLCKPIQQFYDELPAGDRGDIALQIGPDDFIQGQREGNRQMIRQVIEWCEDARFVVDLFSGVGNLSLPVAKALGAQVAGAELNPASVRAANANAKQLQLDARYLQANLFEMFSVEPFAGADVLILDPPRRGAKKVCEMMGTLLPAKIIMVNCDVASGGRDGETLQSFGYRLHSLRALDLFPYTGHVEAMSLWVR